MKTKQNRLTIKFEPIRIYYSDFSDNENTKKRYTLSNQKRLGMFKNYHVSPEIIRTDESHSLRNFYIKRHNNHFEMYTKYSRGTEGSIIISTRNKNSYNDNKVKNLNRTEMSEKQNKKDLISRMHKNISLTNNINNNLNSNKSGQKKYCIMKKMFNNEK